MTIKFSITGAGLAAILALSAPAALAQDDAIDFGDNSSTWANDGECDDPRFTGPTGDGGMAINPIEEDRLRDADDCRANFEAGRINLAGAPARDAPAQIGEVDFGDDSSMWANDGECDDPRFAGPVGDGGVAETLLEEDRGRDATDCRTNYEAGRITLAGERRAPAITTVRDGDIDFGDDSSEWANDGECDDPRFVGRHGSGGMATVLLDVDRSRDAADCEANHRAGGITFVGDDSRYEGIDFGDNSSEWAQDGECDDPRFSGEEGIGGMAAILLDEDEGRDRTDCMANYAAGKIRLN